MKRVLLALLGLALAVSACTSSASNGTFQFRSANQLGTLIPAADRAPAGTFTGTLIDGGTIGSRQLRGKVTLVNFWASWCGPCKVESPQLDLLYRRMKSKGVEVIGVDTKDAQSSARAFIRSYDISYPIVFDENGEIQIRMGAQTVRGLPFSILLDKSGDVAAVYLGELTIKDLAGPIDTLRAEQER
jgi:thiol-disulfide isomerase/thioredoxin